MNQWLQGGPFLEVSFILENNNEREKFIHEFFAKLKNIPQEFQIKTDTLDDKINEFSKGYPYDEKDPNTYQVHSLEIPLLINVSGERRSKLCFEEISKNTIQINFCFFGDENDAPEWNQKGIQDKDMPEFTKFLSALYEVFEFPIGAIAEENDCVSSFFECGEWWPNECYKLHNINMQKIIDNVNNSYIIDCLFDADFFKLKDIPLTSKKIGKSGVLMKKLWAQWNKIENHLNKAFSLLPQNPVDNQEGGQVKYFYEFLNANELELALDELEGLSEVNEVTNEFWKELFEAASAMELKGHQARYLLKLGKAK